MLNTNVVNGLSLFDEGLDKGEPLLLLVVIYLSGLDFVS